MEFIHRQPAGNLAAMMRHLVRAAELEADSEGLTPLQWSALHYLGLANGISRTVSGFATYNATSRGTASQVIKSLVQKGLVRRERVARDARSAELQLTAVGQQLIDASGGTQLAAAIDSLGYTDRQHLEAIVTSLMEQLQPPRGRVQLGSCHDCSHLGERCGVPMCYRAEKQLNESDLHALCAAHSPGEGKGVR